MNHTVNEINKLQENQREIVKEFCSTQFDLEGLKRHILNSKFLEKFNINDVINNRIINTDEDNNYHSISITEQDRIIKRIVSRNFIIALQQFCFWIPNGLQMDFNMRGKLNSSDLDSLIHYNTKSDEHFYNSIRTLIATAHTLRKERLDLLEESIKFNISMGDVGHLLMYFYNNKLFLYDFFKKKKEYFIMSICRYVKYSNTFRNHNTQFNELMKLCCNPCIDYQIPKMLEVEYGLFSYLGEKDINIQRLNDKIEREELFIQDSPEQVSYRSLSYAMMLLIEEIINEEYPNIKVNQEELDTLLFEKRNDYKSRDTKFHLCLTTQY